MKQALIATISALISAAAISPAIEAKDPVGDAVGVAKKPVIPHRRRASGTPPGVRPGPDRNASQRAVCQSQCNLERMGCDQGRAGAYQNRADQLQAAQASCLLAVQGCLSRC